MTREVMLQERHKLLCPAGHPLRLKHLRIRGGIGECTHIMPGTNGHMCPEKFFISGAVICQDGRMRYVVHRVTTEQLEQLDSMGPTTVEKILLVLGLE